MDNQANTIDQQIHMQAIKAVHTRYIEQQITVLNKMKQNFAPEVVQAITKSYREGLCQPYESYFSGNRSINDLINTLWEPLRNLGYVFSTTEVESGIQIHCTRCPFANLYRDAGGEEWGYQLYCAADEDLVVRFNPKIRFERTKSLMEGHDCCNHRYIKTK